MVAEYQTVFAFNRNRPQTESRNAEVVLWKWKKRYFLSRRTPLTRDHRAPLELQLLENSTLRRHRIEFARREVRERTETIMRSQQTPLDTSTLSGDFAGKLNMPARPIDRSPKCRIRKLFVAAVLAYWACIPAWAAGSIDGITEPFVDVKLSSSAAGIIRTEFFKEGDLVQKGTVILELDKTLEELETARRQLIMTRNKTDMQSTRALLNTRVVSREEMLKKETEFRVSEAEYGMAVEQLAKRRIATPFSGCVVELLLHAGEACEPYEPLVRVVDTTRFYFVGYVEAAAVAGLRLGQSVKVEISTSGAPVTLTGAITYISPVVDPASGLAKIKALFANEEGKIRPGVPGKLLLD